MATKSVATTAKQRKDWQQQQWVKYVNEGLTGAAKSIIEAGQRMYEFKTQSKCCKGGSEFGRIAQEKLGMSPAMSSRWATIGEKSANLLVATKNLPQSMEAVYLISTLEKDEILKAVEEGVINPGATQKEIKALKQPQQKPTPRTPQDPPGPNGNEDKEWKELVEDLVGDEELATAVWDEIISKADAKKIANGYYDEKRMAKKLYGKPSEPNMLPSQISSILRIPQEETNELLGIKPKRAYFFEVTDDVVALENELKKPQDIEAMKTKEARKLYEHFKRIVDLWSDILEE